jgi:hypothetical protein
VVRVSSIVHTDPSGIGSAGETACAVVTFSVPEELGPLVSVQLYWTGNTRVVPPV